MKPPRITWGKGLNADLLASELADGFCSNAQNARFRNGFAERALGISTIYTAAAQPVWIGLYPNTTGFYDVYNLIATSNKAYANDFAGTTTEITRFTEGVAITSITRAGTTATLTTGSNHGRSNGDTVSIWGASPSQYNGTYVIGGVTATTWTYTMASDPGASASPVGLYSYNGATSNFSALSAGEKHSGGVLNGIALLNVPPDGLYYWSGDTAVRLRKVPNSNNARIARPFKNYVVQLAPTVSGTTYPFRVAWSQATEPGSIPTTFTASDTNDAGDVELAETGSELVDCLPLGDTNIIYTGDARYAMQYIGGDQVFRFTKLPGSDGLVTAEAVVNTPVGHVFMNTSFEVMLHTGGACRNLSAGRVNSLLVPWTQPSQTFLMTVPEKNEVWVCLQSTAVSGADRVMIWNWVEDTWGIKNMSSTTILYAGASGLLGTYTNGQRAIVVGESSKVGLVDNGITNFGESFDAFIERSGLDLGDADTIKNLQRSRWNLDGVAGGTYSIQHGSAMTADAAPTYASVATYTLGTTDYVNSRATGGRFLALKMTWVSTSAKVRSTDLDVTAGGKR